MDPELLERLELEKKKDIGLEKVEQLELFQEKDFEQKGNRKIETDLFTMLRLRYALYNQHHVISDKIFSNLLGNITSAEVDSFSLYTTMADESAAMYKKLIFEWITELKN
jgi:hypothetical protein